VATPAQIYEWVAAMCHPLHKPCSSAGTPSARPALSPHWRKTSAVRYSLRTRFLCGMRCAWLVQKSESMITVSCSNCHVDNPKFPRPGIGPRNLFTGPAYVATASRSGLTTASVHSTPGDTAARHTRPQRQALHATEGVRRCQGHAGPCRDHRTGLGSVLRPELPIRCTGCCPECPANGTI
jgi:hypothetical protein